eukprot:1177614-Prorocentrum_minimum.AAC.2
MRRTSLRCWRTIRASGTFQSDWSAVRIYLRSLRLIGPTGEPPVRTPAVRFVAIHWKRFMSSVDRKCT